MSFRSYLVSISKEEADRIRNMTEKEIYNFYNIEGISDFLFKLKTVFEFGAYSDFDSGILKISNNFFRRKETIEKLDEYYFKEIDENCFIKIIDLVRESIADYFSKLSNDVQKSKKHIESKKRKWNDKILVPYNIGKNKSLIDDDSYEYNIFELVKIYKEFDFDKNILLFIGY